MNTLRSLAVAGVAVGILTAGAGFDAPIRSASAEEITVKLWTRADRSGPLRGGNIVMAGDTLNRMLAATGIDTRVKVEVHENNAKGFDADALDLLKAFAADKGPDVYVAAHEWIGAFTEAGYAMNLEEHIAANREFYDDIIEVLWDSVRYKGARHGVPQDSEVRMFFYNKNTACDEAGMNPTRVHRTASCRRRGPRRRGDDLDDIVRDLAKKVVDNSQAAKYGIMHRPSKGPDYLMILESFGIGSSFQDEKSEAPDEPFCWNARNWTGGSSTAGSHAT